MIIDSATGDAWDAIGDFLRAHGREDASGSRRMMVSLIAQDAAAKVMTWTGCSREQYDALKALLVEAWGPVPEKG